MGHFTRHDNICANTLRYKVTMKRVRPPRRLDSVSDRIMQTLFNRQRSPEQEEIDYLFAAEQGDYATVQQAVTEWSVNINCLDHLGRSALELALIGDHQTIVEYLLPRSNLQCIEDTLLYAISRENVKVCELILDHPLYKNQKIQLSDSDGFYQKDTDTPRLRPNTTPIVLAAQKNNFYIVQLLLLRGSSISPPHDYFCDCTECSNMRVFDSVKYSESRLNTYKALASPAYISLSSNDPILTAFELSEELRKLSEIEKEYKYEYHKLCDKCKNYTVELLDLCRSTEEILAVLNEDSDGSEVTQYSSVDARANSLARVKLALKYQQKRFIAHPTCQRQLISLWYSGVPWMRHQHIAVKLLAVPLATLMLPFMSLIFVIVPHTLVGQKMCSPFVKFLNHTCSYMVFLVFMFMGSLRTGSGNPLMDMACHGFEQTLPDSAVFLLILIWVLGMMMHECSQLYQEGLRGYVTDWWNWIDLSLIFLYLSFYSLQISVFVKLRQMSAIEREQICPDLNQVFNCREMSCRVNQAARNWTSCYPGGTCEDIDYLYSPQGKQGELGRMEDLITEANQISDIFFALANVLSFGRIAHLLPANEQLGPLLVSFGRMLHDVVRFGVVFILVLLAFMCGLTSLYRTHQCENKHFSRMDLTLSSLFWATFGMGDTSATKIDYRYLGVNKDLIGTHSKHHPITAITGSLLLWSYIVGSVVVLLNMLIAMMSNSFQEIYDDRDVEWKFARARLWIDYFEDGRVLPAPFNMIPSPMHLVPFFKWCKKKVRGVRDEPPLQMSYIYNRRKNGMTNGNLHNVELPAKPETFYRQVTRRLVQRYIYKYQTEISQLTHHEAELESLQKEMSTLGTNVKKMRHEMSHIKDSMMARLNNMTSNSAPHSPTATAPPPNGLSARPLKTVNSRARIELHI